ncbi:MAG: hypothetical protein RLZZ299_2815 [Pseudomonadota bacterium]|jgi:hypothetical protein
MLWLLLVACTPDFDESRGDLLSARILALGERDGALRAPAWSGLGPWHEESVATAWTDAAGAAVDAATPPAPPWALDAEVTFPDGATERGVLRRADAQRWGIDDVQAIQDADGVDLTVVAPEAVAVRWAVDAGTLVPTGSHAARWDMPEDGSIATAFALALDEAGGTAWAWIDATRSATGTVRVGTRRFRADGAVSGDVEARLTEDPDEGWALTGLVSAASPSVPAPACGARPDGSFDVDALADGRCGRADVSGATVWLRGVSP